MPELRQEPEKHAPRPRVHHTDEKQYFHAPRVPTVSVLQARLNNSCNHGPTTSYSNRTLRDRHARETDTRQNHWIDLADVIQRQTSSSGTGTHTQDNTGQTSVSESSITNGQPQTLERSLCHELRGASYKRQQIQRTCPTHRWPTGSHCTYLWAKSPHQSLHPPARKHRRSKKNGSSLRIWLCVRQSVPQIQSCSFLRLDHQRNRCPRRL